MHSLLDLFNRLRDVRGIIAWGGYVGLTLVIFAETGLLVGFFFPGDSLLVTAGLLAATTGALNIYWLVLLLTIASVVVALAVTGVRATASRGRAVRAQT